MISTFILCGLAILGLCGALVLFVSLKQELRANTIRNRRNIDALSKSVAEKLAQTPEPVRDQAMEAIYIPAAPRAGLNITKRVLAMRMVRRNEDIGHIAAALGVTRREVELLIRVQRISNQAAKAATAN